MNLLKLERMRWLWATPIAAIAVLWALASIGPGSANTACERNGLGKDGSIPGCKDEAVDSRRMPVGLEHVPADQASDHERQLLAAGTENSGVPKYSERRIRMLNETMPIPEAGPALLEEIERLSLQQRRFERRYGPESVAARSVRLRLRDLHDHVSTGLQYAVGDKREAVED